MFAFVSIPDLREPMACTAEAHAHLRSSPQALVDLTTPGARTEDPEHPGRWQELRHCIVCRGTFTLEGQGVSRRWVYGITDHASGLTSFANTLEGALPALLTEGLPASAVSRYNLGDHHHGLLTTGESFWLGEALRVRGQL